MARYVPKGTNQKLKLYYLAKIMVNNTGDEHAMTLQDIKNALEQYEITADRKSLYDDFNVLRDMGIDILREQRGRSYYYHVGKKKFELAELKLLVDAIHSAIANNRMIQFQYFQWNTKKKMEMRHNGQFYKISPWALTWDDENYYLVGYDAQAEKIKHYRVDKMRKLSIMEDRCFT